MTRRITVEGEAPLRFLSLAEFAARVGVKTDTLNRYPLPEADAMTGKIRGWLPESVDAWNANRPGQGARTDLRRDTTNTKEIDQ